MSQAAAGRHTAEFVIADGGCWIRAGSRDASFVAVPDRGWDSARYLGDDMVLAGPGPLVPTTMREALADLITAGLGAIGRAGKHVVALNFVHPSHWGVRRVQQLRTLGHGLGYSVTCTPFATAVCRRQTSSHGGVALVLESGELSTCASVVSSDGTILECRYESALGTADLREADAAAARFADLMNRAGIDRVIITGAAGAELDTIAEQAARPATVAVGAQSLRTGERRAARSLPSRLAAVPRGWWLTAGAVAVAIVVAGTFAFLHGKGPTQVSEDTAIALGKLEVLVPKGWSYEERPMADSRQQRVDLSLDGRPDRRIIVIQNDVPKWTTNGDAKRALERLIEQENGVFSPLESVVFAGRQALFYSEKPSSDASEIRWYTLLDRAVQTSVGCQFLPGVWDEMAASCEQVVGSIQVVG